MDHYRFSLYRYHYLNRSPDTFPEVDTSIFQQSARVAEQLMNQVNKLTQMISSSNSLAFNIMDAAQRSQTEQVKQLIRQAGIDSPTDVSYDPDGIRITLLSNRQKITKVSVFLQWR